jgi:nucleotide-binding universal stress UspA family protein
MKRFERILLLYDRETCSAAVLQRAASLAREQEAQVTVIEVIAGLPSDVRRVVAIMGPLLLEDPEELLIRERTDQLVQLLEPMRKEGVPAKAKVVVGALAREIIRELLENAYDLLILTADRKRGWKRRLSGGTAAAGLFGRSLAEKVLRHARCSVLIVPPNYP